MASPRIEVDLARIRCNARHLVLRLGRHGIAVTGVTKGVCGDPDIAQALLDGGVAGLSDARIENVERMRQAGIRAPVALLRPSMPEQANRVVRGCTASYDTELDTVDGLARAARHMNMVHDVILMVEMGDMREGIMPDDLVAAARAVVRMPGVALKGIGANFACLGGTAPTAGNMADLIRLADEVERACGQGLDTISGGNSASLPWAFGQATPGRINDLKLGEAILLGVDPLSGRRIDGLFTDAFSLIAEVIESKIKPRNPPRPRDGSDAPASGDGVCPRRARQSILAIGEQDTDLAGLTLPAGLASLGGTSDQLVIETSGRDFPIGTEIALRPNYSALMRAMNAAGVARVMRNRRPRTEAMAEDRHRPDLALA